MPTPSLFSLFPSRGGVDRILFELRAAGFSSTDLGALFFARRPESGRDRPGLETVASSADPVRSALLRIAGVSQLVVPGVGSFIAAGPIIPALHQARNGKPGVAIARGLMHLGVSDDTAARYERGIKNEGSIMISVHTAEPERLRRARALLAEFGADEICLIDGPSPSIRIPVSATAATAPAV